MGWEKIRRNTVIRGLLRIATGVNGGDIDFCIMSNEGAPTDGTSGTGAGVAGKGSLCADVTNGVIYINGGTKASPAWEPIGAGGSLGSLVEVRNETGGTLAAGTPVYISGYNASEDKWLITKADADAAGRIAQFVTTASLATATNGLAAKVYRGTVNGTGSAALDLSGAAVGDPVYLDVTAGECVLAAPSGADDQVQIIGRVAVVATDIVEVYITDATVIGTNELAALAVTTAKIAASAVTGAKMATGIVKQNLIAGIDETMDTTYDITGMAAGDEIVGVIVLTTAASIATAAQRANADFTAGANVMTVGANAVDNTGNQLLVTWIDHT